MCEPRIVAVRLALPSTREGGSLAPAAGGAGAGGEVGWAGRGGVGWGGAGRGGAGRGGAGWGGAGGVGNCELPACLEAGFVAREALVAGHAC